MLNGQNFVSPSRICYLVFAIEVLGFKHRSGLSSCPYVHIFLVSSAELFILNQDMSALTPSSHENMFLSSCVKNSLTASSTLCFQSLCIFEFVYLLMCI